MAKLPDTRRYASVGELADATLAEASDTPLLIAETEAGLDEWTGRDLLRRSRYATARMISAGIAKGDPVLIWAPSGPKLVAAFLGAYRAGIIPVPLDLRFTSEVVSRVADRAGTRRLIFGEAPNLTTSDSTEPYERFDLEDLVRDSTDDLPADWESQIAALPKPSRKDVFLILYTSGTTGQPRGVMMTNANWLDPWESGYMAKPLVRLMMRVMWRGSFKLVSVMPMSHLMGLGEASSALWFGGTVVYPRGKSTRAMLEALRTHKPTSISGAPRFLELYWRQLTREIEEQGGLEDFESRRAQAARRPYFMRRRMFKRELAMIGGKVTRITSAAAYLPPDLQARWESIGLPVYQGYGATECGGVSMTSAFRHPIGKVGKPTPIAKVELAIDGEILVSGPSVTAGYWRDPEATKRAWDEQGRYHTGDIGRFDGKGNLVLIGRKKNIIVLDNGLNVYPEDIEVALHEAGLGETVVLETAPGRIEAVILDPQAELAAMNLPATSTGSDRREALYQRIEAAVRAANARLTVHERVDGWRLWPEPDFPRTHTLKIRRDPVRQWASSETVPLPVMEGSLLEA